MRKYTPQALYEILKETVIGQNDYIKTLATTMWLHHTRIETMAYSFRSESKPQKQNLLVVGPTGSGKTGNLPSCSVSTKHYVLATVW